MFLFALWKHLRFQKLFSQALLLWQQVIVRNLKWNRLWALLSYSSMLSNDEADAEMKSF